MRFNCLISGLTAFALLLVSACQPLERPFQPTVKSGTRITPGPRASLYIAPVQNGPEELSQILAKKLQDLGIAAFTGDKPENRYHISSEILLKDKASYVVWTIMDPQGKKTSLTTTRKIGNIVEGMTIDTANLDTTALHSASDIDIMLGGSGINFEKLDKPRVHIPIVVNAPGDGSETLSAAMQDHMAKYGIDVLPDQWQATYLIKGTVSITKPLAGTQVVSIVWKLERRNGEYVGKVEQKNRIRAGALNGPWGPVASAAAQGGARGILKLLRQAEPAYFNKKSG